jgi:hypothetical protein
VALTKNKPVKHRKSVKARATATTKRAASRRTLNGIPLKRKITWVYDTDSPEFKAARRRDMKARRSQDWDRDGMQWVEAVSDDAAWRQWWK